MVAKMLKSSLKSGCPNLFFNLFFLYFFVKTHFRKELILKSPRSTFIKLKPLLYHMVNFLVLRKI